MTNTRLGQSTVSQPSRSAATLAALLLALVLAPPALAQEPPVSFSTPSLLPTGGVAVWNAKPVDESALLAEDDANAGALDLPYRIGYPMATDLAPGKSGTWEDLGHGDRVWRMRLRTPGALWTVVGLDAFRLQSGAKLWIYDAKAATVLGPFTSADVRDHGELWSPPLEGDELVVELYWPAALRTEDPRIHIGTFSHGYKPFGTIGRAAWTERHPQQNIDESGACNIDVNCALGADWQDQKRSVVILLSGGSGFCSASLINNTANDCKPYVLTAHHCGTGASTTFGFNYERSGCGIGDPGAPSTYTVTGATVRGDYASSDFTLLEMNALPPESFNFYFNGWNQAAAPATMTWVIHHPSGDVKKISHDVDPPIDGSNYGANHWRIQNYEQGTTEGGSSGSPLFDQNHRTIGQLHGGTASCTSITYDEFGKVSASWAGGGTAATRLSDWLDPGNTGAVVLDGLNGSTCFFQPAGALSLNRARYACADTVTISLRDDNLRGNATQAVAIASSTETAPETATLSAVTPGSGTFQGTFPVSTVPPVQGDGTLSVGNGDTITVTYIDADDGQGGSNVTRTATGVVDCAPPLISAVQATNVTGNSAAITWTTDESATSVVHYGTTPPVFQTATSPALVAAHSLGLTGLTECSQYAFWVESADGVGNNASDDAGGAYYAFTTGKNTTPSYISTDTPIAIPDNNATGITSTITVPDDKIVQDVNVTMNATHTFDGDLTITLIPPVGSPIVLSNRRGSSGGNFVNTVFDDAATTPIASGTAPFTGSFKPDSPLSAANGIHAAGAWGLKVVDGASIDTGTLNNWTLTLAYPAAQCGPHAAYTSESLVQDTCSTGGAGHADGTWDPGEQVQFKVRVTNDGTSPLTGITVTVTSTTPGVVMIDGLADVADLAAGASGDSISPHVTAKFPASLACGGLVAFNVSVQSGQGTWTGSFTQAAGLTLSGGGTALDESFASGIPASWTVVDGGSGGGAAATWTTANPGARTIAAPMIAPTAIIDSDNAGTGATQDEQLITPVMNLASATTVTLDFDQYFRFYSSGQAELGDVDVRSSVTGGAWVNVLRNQSASSPNPDHKTLNLTAQAAGAADVQVRFHYYQATYEYYWQVDNVKVTYTAPGGCQTNVCLAPTSAPPPVPDGTFGLPMTSDRAAADGSSIALHWDVTACTSTNYKVLYGALANLSTYTIGGAACSLGTAGTATWNAVPAGDLWFVVVATDGAGTEGTWGRTGAGAHEGGVTPSAQCGDTLRNNGGTCP